MANRSNWSLVGIPDHQGVVNVGGRLGSARGPAAFRKMFSKLKGRAQIHSSQKDHGDSAITLDILINHKNAAQKVADAHAASGLSVVVGGGHDHGFTQLQGLSSALKGKKLGCINIDAHLDVRKPSPLITSGSPFYLALESGILSPDRLVEFGIQSHCNAPELWDYVDQKGVRVVPFENLRQGRALAAFKQELSDLGARCDWIAVSLDLDAAAAAFAPGVSAPQAEGFSSSEIIEMMEIAGLNSQVISLGIFELCPEHDVDDRTARLAATAAWHYLEKALS